MRIPPAPACTSMAVPTTTPSQHGTPAPQANTTNVSANTTTTTSAIADKYNPHINTPGLTRRTNVSMPTTPAPATNITTTTSADEYNQHQHCQGQHKRRHHHHQCHCRRV